MRLTKRIALAGSVTLAAGAVVLGIAPAAHAGTGSNCTWTSGNSYELCEEINSTSSGGQILAFATSWDGGQNFHVQVINPAGATLCNSPTEANPAGVTASCTWDFKGSVPGSGEFCAILWVVHDFEYQKWAETCVDS